MPVGTIAIIHARRQRRAGGDLRRCDGRGLEEADQLADARRIETGALGEVAALVLATGAEELTDAVDAEPVELVDGAENTEPPAGVLRPAEADRLHDAVEHLPRVDLDDVLAAGDAERLQRIGGHHADLGIGGRRGGTDGVGIELHELAEAPRPRLLVPEHPAVAVGAVRLREPLVVLRDVAGERRRQVVAERQPLLVVVLEREHAFVRTVLVRQELAERLGIFDERRLHRLEAVTLVDGADPHHHRLGGTDGRRITVGKATGQARLDQGPVGRHRRGSSLG